MEDIYAALVGEPVSDGEKVALLAQKLRKKQELGQLGQITGDRVLSPMGAGMVKNVNDTAERLGQQASTDRWRKTQDAMNERNLLARAKEAELDRAHRARENALDRAARLQLERDIKGQAKLDAARERAISKTAAMWNKDQIASLVQGADQANMLLQYYKDKPLPGVGRIEGFFPDMAIGTEAQMVRSTIAGLGNLLMKSRSGAAVTDQEMKRLLREMAQGNFDESVFRRRWPEILKMVEMEQNLALANLPDQEARDEFFSRLGRDQFQASDPFVDGAPVAAEGADGEEDLSYEAFLQSGGQ